MQMTFRSSFKTLIFAITVACLLVGCSVNPLRRVSIEVHDNANNSQTTAVDIVLIYDAKLMLSLPQNSAEWFEKKSIFLAKSNQEIEVISIQLPPASASVLVKLPKNSSEAVGVMSYANYATPEGQLRGYLNAHACARIILEAKRISYADCI